MLQLFEKRNCKAAISIFLIIILIPCMVLSAVLVDGSRARSARAIVQEAMDLAVASALADYNMDLKDQFGLFAVRDAGKVEEIYKDSLNSTLMAYGLDGAEYSDMIWNFMKMSVSGKKSYMGEDFLNLYDFQTESGTGAEVLFPLEKKEVLKTQMVEYAKFRGIFVALERMDFLKSIGDMRVQAEENEKTAEVMEEKMEVDESNAAADRAVKSVADQIAKLQSAVDAYTAGEKELFEGMEAQMNVIRHRNIYPQEDDLPRSVTSLAGRYGTNKTKLVTLASDIKTQAKELRSMAERAKTEAERATGRLSDFQSEYSGGSEAIQGMAADAGTSRENYRKYAEELEALLRDDNLRYYAETIAPDSLTEVFSRIDKATLFDEKNRVEPEKEAFENRADDAEEDGGENESGEYINEYYLFYDLGLSGSSRDVSGALNAYYKPAVTKTMNPEGHRLDNLKNAAWKNIAPNISAGGSDSTIDENFAKGQSGRNIEDESETSGEGTAASAEAARGEIDKAVYDARPSSGHASDSEEPEEMDFYNTDGDLTASRGMMSSGKHSMIQDVAETARDDVLSLSYMFGTFKTRLTGVEKFSSDGMPQSDKDSFYMPKWRYAYPDGEIDMRFSPKKNRSTVLRGEIEYLIYGMRSDRENEDAVYATIYAERLANNMIALYCNHDVKTACDLAAALASAATGGIVPQPVFFWIFLTAWAVAETFVDMNYLVNGGYKIPLIKTKDNLILAKAPTDGALIGNYKETGFFVTYEDYLLLLLLLKGDDKRIMRSADLIEYNMKKIDGQEDFSMAEAYTCIKADADVSLRYLFGDVMPFQSLYRDNGYGGRMHFSGTVYLGY